MEFSSEYDQNAEKALPLVPSHDPILTTKLLNFDFQNPEIDPIEVAHTLAQTCLMQNGLGLSCNQIGLPVRAMIIKANPMLCMFNPVIVGRSEATTVDEEGCLSFPGLILKIQRNNVIRVRYARPNGEIVTEKYEGMTSRIIQHETDHLDGVVFTRKVSKLMLDMAQKRAAKLRKKHG